MSAMVPMSTLSGADGSGATFPAKREANLAEGVCESLFALDALGYCDLRYMLVRVLDIGTQRKLDLPWSGGECRRREVLVQK